MEDAPVIKVIADPGTTWYWEGSKRQSWRQMLDLIDIAAESGATHFKPQWLKASMYRDGTDAAKLVRTYEMPESWLPRLAKATESAGLTLLITPYRAEDVPTLDPYVKSWKVAGFDNTNKKLRDAIRRTKKPVIVSTGLLDDSGLWEAERFWKVGSVPPVLLHCVSQYPAPAESMNMRVMFSRNYHCVWTHSDPHAYWETWPMGLSDHSIGSAAAVMAVAYGARHIEKHIRHWNTPPENPDYAAACAVEDFPAYVKAIRDAEKMLGDGWKKIEPGEWAHYKYDPTTGRRGGD